MSAILKSTTSMTLYVPISLKIRVEAAAGSDERSVSQYVCRILEKLVPPLNPTAASSLQIDLEDAIAERKLAEPEARHARKIVKASRRPARGK
jgi:hypothetical protein